MITQSVVFFVNSFTMKYTKKKKKKKIKRNKKAICERPYSGLPFLLKCCLHVEIIPAHMGARQVQD